MDNQDSKEAHELGLELEYGMKLDSISHDLGPKISEAFVASSKNEDIVYVEKFKQWLEMSEKSFPNYLGHRPTDTDLKNIEEVLKFGRIFLEELK